MKNQILTYILCSFLIVNITELYSSDLKLVGRLSGYWKFSIGDDPAWSKMNYNDQNWDQIIVPENWEDAGYKEYNGYAWYRKHFTIYHLPDESPIFLRLGRIDDVDEVYLNGKLIGSGGSFPPNYVSAHEDERKYIIPKGLLNYDGNNVLAVRVYDSYGGGGIRGSTVGIFIDADYSLLDYSLAGLWQFKPGNRREWSNMNFDASAWNRIQVPAEWESQGYNNYDGYACYRKEFIFPNNLRNESKYLILGKIDDLDEVFFNGELIGTVYDLKSKYSYRSGSEYNIKRAYYIPEGLIRYNQTNVITVVVYDGQGRGGIYEGPIGIMNEYSYNRYHEKYERPVTIWDYLYEWLVD